MAINFPDSPNVNDTYTVDDKTFIWTGDYWRVLNSPNYISTLIKDADNDTKVTVENAADEDVIRMYTGGSERVSVGASAMIPATNETYDLGSPTNRFKDLYLSGSSIDLGGVQITSDGTNLNLPPIASVSGDFTVDNYTFHVDSTNNRIGIGISSPTYSLDVVGTVNASERIRLNSVAALYVDGDLIEVGSAAAGKSLSFAAGASNRMTITSSGNVGIGNSLPSYSLDVTGDIRVTGNLIGNASTATKLATARTISLTSDVTGSASFDGSGNVSISATVANDSHTHDSRYYTESESLALFATISGQRFTGGVSAVSGTFDGATGSGSTLYVDNNSANTTALRGITVDLGNDATNLDSGDDFIRFRRGDGTEIGGVRGTGTTTVSYNTSSDYRLKTVLGEIDDGLIKIRQLLPRYGYWKDDNYPDRIHQYWVAHELQEVVPGAVSGEKDAVDEEGNPDYQSVDYGKITPLLAAAIKELDQIVSSLISRVKALEAN